MKNNTKSGIILGSLLTLGATLGGSAAIVQAADRGPSGPPNPTGDVAACMRIDGKMGTMANPAKQGPPAKGSAAEAAAQARFKALRATPGVTVTQDTQGRESINIDYDNPATRRVLDTYWESVCR